MTGCNLEFGDDITLLMAGGTKESRKVVVMPLNLLKMFQEVFWPETNLTIVSYGRYKM